MKLQVHIIPHVPVKVSGDKGPEASLYMSGEAAHHPKTGLPHQISWPPGKKQSYLPRVIEEGAGGRIGSHRLGYQ